jgi:hypothetical protein
MHFTIIAAAALGLATLTAAARITLVQPLEYLYRSGPEDMCKQFPKCRTHSSFTTMRDIPAKGFVADHWDKTYLNTIIASTTTASPVAPFRSHPLKLSLRGLCVEVDIVHCRDGKVSWQLNNFLLPESDGK